MNPTYRILFLFVFIAAVAGCKKENLAELNKGNTPLVLSASANTILLKEKNRDNDALVMTWTTGSNQGSNAGISYTLQMAKEGTGFADAVTEDLGKSVYEKKITTKVLNDTLLKHFSAAPGAEFSLEARVVAKTLVDGSDEEVSPPVTIKVTPYTPVSATLFLLGDASPNGWNNATATALTPIAAEPGGFIWTGRLNVGELKFLTTLGQFIPTYNKGASATSLFYRTSFDQPDDKFQITEAAIYDVKINIIDLTVSIIKSAAPVTPPYSRLWIVGDATPNGWNIDDPNKMQVDSGNLFVFNYGDILAAGEFKIPTATGNWGADFYMPIINHPAVTATDVQLVVGGSPDNKWQITTPGAYKIKLDLFNMKISIKPFTPYTQLWLVGDATPVGWNIDSPAPMTADPNNPNIFTWQGAMTVGEFKIPVGTGNWGGDFFMPMVNHQSITSPLAKFVPGGSPDNKWQITVAGNYKITFNQLKETVEILKR